MSKRPQTTNQPSFCNGSLGKACSPPESSVCTYKPDSSLGPWDAGATATGRKKGNNPLFFHFIAHLYPSSAAHEGL